MLDDLDELAAYAVAEAKHAQNKNPPEGTMRNLGSLYSDPRLVH